MLTILLAALACVGLAALLWLVLGLFLLPAGGYSTVRVSILASGEARGLEHTLDGLRWLQSAGLLEAKIDIVDEDLSPEGRRRAELLTRTRPGTRLVKPGRRG